MEALISSFLDSFLTFLLLYKYAALFLIAFTAALALPLPASTTLAAAGAFASQGYLNLYAVLLVALAANVAGDITGYLLARRYGEEILRKIGFRRLLRSSAYHRFRDYLLDFPQSVVYVTRFLTEVGPAVNLLSGLARIPYRTFFTFDVLGEASYVLLYGLVGYFLGSQWESSLGFLARAVLMIVSVGVTINVIQILLYRARHKRQH